MVAGRTAIFDAFASVRIIDQKILSFRYLLNRKVITGATKRYKRKVGFAVGMTENQVGSGLILRNRFFRNADHRSHQQVRLIGLPFVHRVFTAPFHLFQKILKHGVIVIEALAGFFFRRTCGMNEPVAIINQSRQRGYRFRRLVGIPVLVPTTFPHGHDLAGFHLVAGKLFHLTEETWQFTQEKGMTGLFKGRDGLNQKNIPSGNVDRLKQELLNDFVEFFVLIITPQVLALESQSEILEHVS